MRMLLYVRMSYGYRIPKDFKKATPALMLFEMI